MIDSALGSGGTWEGALEALAQKWVPLYVRIPGNGPGNAALVDKGGVAFTFVSGQGESLLNYFEREDECVNNLSESAPPQQSLLSVDNGADDATLPNAVAASWGDATPVVDTLAEVLERLSGVSDGGANEASEPLMATSAIEPKADNLAATATSVSIDSTLSVLDVFDDFLRKLSLVLHSGPLSEDEIAKRLVLENGQAKVWLKRAVEYGQVEKLKKPVRYARGRQPSLLG